MEPLTPKQEEVIRLMAKGLTNGQIAEHMGITLSGAKWHVSEVLSKLGVSSREEAVALWKQQRGIGARLHGFIGALSLPKLAGGGAAAAGIGGVVVAGTILLTGGDAAGGGDEPTLPEPSGDEASAVVAGQCEDAPAPDGEVPLCASMEPDEVRFTVAIDGAAVDIDGLAGADLHRARLEFANGSDVYRSIGAPVAAADGGGTFQLRGTFASPPARLQFMNGDNVLVEHDLAQLLDLSDWPEPRPAGAAGVTNHAPAKVDGDCLQWQLEGRDIELCAGTADTGDRWRSGHGESNWYFAGIRPGEMDMAIAGLANGTLVELQLFRHAVPSGQVFTAVAATSPEIRTLTFRKDGTDAIHEQSPPVAISSMDEGARPQLHRLEFEDGAVLVGVDEQGCVWTRETSGASLTRGCGGPMALRTPEDFPITLTSVQPHPGNRIWHRFVVNAQTDYIEFVDEDGNAYREAAQPIPSPYFDLGYVLFDRLLEGNPDSYRAIGHDGEVLETYAYHHGADPDEPALRYPRYAGLGTGQSIPFNIEPPYSEGKWTVSYGGHDRFIASLECDTGNVEVLNTEGPLTGPEAEISVDYPTGATTCVWYVEATGRWSFHQN